MSRPFSHDSRSPTIGQTPSRHDPIQTTEAPANEPSLRQLLDGLRWKVIEDRKEQDELFRAFTKVKKAVTRIRKEQDEYLQQVSRALSQVENAPQDDEAENGISQESQTQIYDYNEGNDDFRTLSDVEDSVLGGPTKRDESQGLFVREQSHHMPEPTPTIRSAAEIARSRTIDGDGRESVDRHATSLLATFDGLTKEHEREDGVELEPSSSEIDGTSRMATPITPGMTRTLLRTSMKKKKTPPAPTVESEDEPTSIYDIPNSPSPESVDVELPSVDELCTPAPQAQMTSPRMRTDPTPAPRTSPIAAGSRPVPPSRTALAPSASRNTTPPPRTPTAAPRTDVFQRMMQPPPSRTKKTPSSKSSKRKRDESVDFMPSSAESSNFEPTASAEPRTKRMAASAGQARTAKFYSFVDLPAREASQAFQDEDRSPFINCGNCGKATCKDCEERRQIRQNSTPSRRR